MKDVKKEILTPAEFYRMRRPEYFSDTETIREIELPREILSLELENITTNQKENEFESLCRRLAEKFIAPNLIPQVGPTGGGDGKTDSETYPVSKTISDRWFVPENGWDKDEKWAFAISAKKSWKSKANDDIKKIIGTNREYTRIFFMTNQLPSSKKKKDAQDEFKKEYKVDVVILDGEWIIEKVYNNNLIDLVVDSLNMTQIYKNKKTILGKNDSKRIKRLEELENNINNPNRYFEYDFQLVEDTLEAAIISRMIEKPRDEVEGKFDRAFRFCKKLNFEKQWTRLHYQRAWTYLNWYNDYSLFIEEYKSFKNYVLTTTSISDVELFFNLYNLLKGLSSTIVLSDYKIDLDHEKSEFFNLLNTFEINKEKPTSSLIAKTYKALIELTDSHIKGINLDQYFKTLSDIFDDCQGLLEYPFESFKEIIEELGNIFSTQTEYDNLIDKIAFISEKRNSELSAGEVFIRRGRQKLEQKNYKDSIIYFGKAVLKLSKEESQNGMFLSLIGLGYAYSEMGLIWASNNCFISAAFISLKAWFETGKITKRAINCINQITKNELFIGRIPILLTWYEMYSIISRQIPESDSDDIMPSDILFDTCLGTRLLNTDFSEISKHIEMPDILSNCGLWMSRKALLYILGYNDILVNESKDDSFAKGENIDEFFTRWANQPFRNQIIYKTNFVDEDKIILITKILGCEIEVILQSNIEMILASETLLAFIEGFFSTCLTGVYPKTEKIIIKIINNENDSSITFKKNETYNGYDLTLRDFNISNRDIKDTWQALVEFTSHVFLDNFFIEEPLEYIKKLFEKEELNERLSLIFHHRNFTLNILGNNPKFTSRDWIKPATIKQYPLKRERPLTFHIEEELNTYSGATKPKLDEVRHDKRKIYSMIDDELWNKAGWVGFGVMNHPQHGFGLLLCFKSGDIGRKIFDNWINKIGTDDKEERIRITIIRGVDKNHPHWYRVQISSNIDKQKNDVNNLIFVTSRIHEMNPNNSNNLEYAINTFNSRKEYKLFPCRMINEGKDLEPYFDKGIIKRELNIRYAWEIGENDMEAVVIKKDDIPIIPENINDAPVLKVLKRKR